MLLVVVGKCKIRKCMLMYKFMTCMTKLAGLVLLSSLKLIYLLQSIQVELTLCMTESNSDK